MGWGIDLPTLYVSGHPGLTVSSDGGKTFTERNRGLPSTDVHAFGAGKGVLYGAAPPVGMFASTDGGENWRVVGGQGRSFFGQILVDPGDPRHLIAADAASGVAESRDGGATFANLGGLQSPTWVSWDPDNIKLVIASGRAGAARSENGGKSWDKLVVPKDASILEIDPTDSQTIYAASHDGDNVQVMVSRDGGTTWQTP